MNRTHVIIGAAALLVLIGVSAIAIVLTRPDAEPVSEAPTVGADGVPETPDAEGLAAADRNGDGIVYQSGMHPWVVQDEPGQCPVCGMDLQPVNVSGNAPGTVEIDPVTIQSMGVRTAEVEVKPLTRAVRTTGQFQADERAQTVVTTKVSGWVERLYVDFEGARVQSGQQVLDLYSPDLVATQEEYLLALRNRDRLAGTAAEADAERLIDAARRRLAYWDVTNAQIETLAASGEPMKTLAVYAPASGTVLETTVIEGARVTAGQPLMRLVDLSRLWLMVDVYEQDLAWVDVGTPVAITLPYDPEVRVNGRIDYLYDTLDTATRTVKARVVVSNAGRRFKPGLSADVDLLSITTEALPTVPTEAVVRSANRTVVVLALDEGRFQPIDVTLGLEAGSEVQVLSGLSGGERIVTSAQFLIDSEARLQSSIANMMN
ncbi:MAG: efflux RND transporter periplasmic adaptor subunit [Rhodothermales bacterium]